MKRTNGAAWAMFILLAAGCGDERPPNGAGSSPVDVGSRFEPAASGSVRGQVVWRGARPVVETFTIRANPDSSPVLREQLWRDNPNTPVIDPATNGVGGAVVYLRGVELARSRPWDLAPVGVEMRQRRFFVMQGSTPTSVGFVRRGDSIDMVSKESVAHGLHAGGAAFFSLPFPDPEQARSRRLDTNGIVELTSSAGFFWMRGYLFVDDHPYYARTDAQGHFELPQVPPGDYELVCWMPNWIVAEHDRDPETSFISRIRFAASAERVQKLHLQATESRELRFEMSKDDFQR